jgi:TatD DNase family protein
MLIDTHCHLEDPEVLRRARAAGVERFVNIGCDIETSKAARDFAAKESDVFFTTGVHPHDAGKAPSDYIGKLRELAADKKCVGMGECGLDYYYDYSDRVTQRKVFAEQIALSQELEKPLVVHVRDAYSDCLEALRNHQGTKIIHCFSGDREHAKAFLALGCYLSISGIVTFKNADELRAVVIETPLERLLIETDSPYLAPVPHRGKPNEPAFVKLVAEKIAELRNLSLESVIEQTGKNALGVFWADKTCAI